MTGREQGSLVLPWTCAFWSAPALSSTLAMPSGASDLLPYWKPVLFADQQGFVPHRTPSYYRTADGAEVDLLFERAGRVETMIEIERSTAPELSRGFRSAQHVLRPKEAYLLHGGSESWPIGKGVTATSLAELMRQLDATAG